MIIQQSGNKNQLLRLLLCAILMVISFTATAESPQDDRDIASVQRSGRRPSKNSGRNTSRNSSNRAAPSTAWDAQASSDVQNPSVSSPTSCINGGDPRNKTVHNVIMQTAAAEAQNILNVGYSNDKAAPTPPESSGGGFLSGIFSVFRRPNPMPLPVPGATQGTVCYSCTESQRPVVEQGLQRLPVNQRSTFVAEQVDRQCVETVLQTVKSVGSGTSHGVCSNESRGFIPISSGSTQCLTREYVNLVTNQINMALRCYAEVTGLPFDANLLVMQLAQESGFQATAHYRQGGNLYIGLGQLQDHGAIAALSRPNESANKYITDLLSRSRRPECARIKNLMTLPRGGDIRCAFLDPKNGYLRSISMTLGYILHRRSNLGDPIENVLARRIGGPSGNAEEIKKDPNFSRVAHYIAMIAYSGEGQAQAAAVASRVGDLMRSQKQRSSHGASSSDRQQREFAEQYNLIMRSSGYLRQLNGRRVEIWGSGNMSCGIVQRFNAQNDPWKDAIENLGLDEESLMAMDTQ